LIEVFAPRECDLFENRIGLIGRFQFRNERIKLFPEYLHVFSANRLAANHAVVRWHALKRLRVASERDTGGSGVTNEEDTQSGHERDGRIGGRSAAEGRGKNQR
jgi:hypothetical protein